MTDKKNLSHNPPPEDDTEFQQARKKQKESEKVFRERFKEYEPYDLSEIKNIFQKAIESTDLSVFLITLKRINQIIHNSELVYQKLKEEGSIDDPDYFDEKDKADNLKERLEIAILNLGVEAAKQPRSDATPKKAPIIPEKRNALSDTNGAMENNTPDENCMTVEEVAERLGISESTVYHWSLENKIPVSPIGRLLRFRMEDIEKRRCEGTLGKLVNTGASSKKTRKNKHHFIFTKPLEPFINVFVQEGYLDEENAILMNDRFSKEPKLGNTFIEWKKDINSLITFLYLSDRLDFIDKSLSILVREHNSSSKEYKEGGNEGREIKYQVLVNNNFTIAQGGSSGSSLSRAWKKVNEAITELREKIIDKKTGDMTRKEVIDYYFKNKNIKTLRINDTLIDRGMLDIVGQIYKPL
jgi:excisionase family DNA binding protein